MRPKIKGKVTPLIITEEQRDKLREYESSTETGGGYQTLCGSVAHNARLTNGQLVTNVNAADIKRILKAAAREDSGGWQGLFKEIMAQQPKP